ncbi:MAG: hypothetical protein ACRD4H_12770, partial [Candidatus Acidiferrales bacterium]
LRGMLRERGVDGQVEFIPLALQNGPVTALEFRVTGISLPIRGLRFPGASAISEDTLRKD